jgi:hypothetical protein
VENMEHIRKHGEILWIRGNKWEYGKIRGNMGRCEKVWGNYGEIVEEILENMENSKVGRRIGGNPMQNKPGWHMGNINWQKIWVISTDTPTKLVATTPIVIKHAPYGTRVIIVFRVIKNIRIIKTIRVTRVTRVIKVIKIIRN